VKRHILAAQGMIDGLAVPSRTRCGRVPAETDADLGTFNREWVEQPRRRGDWCLDCRRTLYNGPPGGTVSWP
jgi:hypothetical protein